MAKLGWGKKAITEGCINDWYKDDPIGEMVRDMRDNHRLLAQEHGGGKYKDSILVYDRVKFFQAMNLPIRSDELKYIELCVALRFYQLKGKYPQLSIGEAFEICLPCIPETSEFISTKNSKLEVLLLDEHEEAGTPCEICGSLFWKNRDVVITYKI